MRDTGPLARFRSGVRSQLAPSSSSSRAAIATSASPPSIGAMAAQTRESPSSMSAAPGFLFQSSRSRLHRLRSFELHLEGRRTRREIPEPFDVLAVAVCRNSSGWERGQRIWPEMIFGSAVKIRT